MNTRAFGFLAGIALIMIAYHVATPFGKYIESKTNIEVVNKETK